MERYAALLRGINISGKNKIAMPALKAGFEAAGFSAVSTYLNSGNVLFSSESGDVRSVIERMTAERFGLDIPVYVLRLDALRDILAHAPDWWGLEDRNRYDNLIFILSADSADDICALLGEPSPELERVQVYENAIFWTFERNAYQKCAWWKRTASAGIAEKLTIRTANTLRRLCRQTEA